MTIDSSIITSEDFTTQLHRRFTDGQIKDLFQSYRRGQLSMADLQDMLGIGPSRFFVLLKVYRRDPQAFSIVCQRTTHSRLSAEVEEEIQEALLQEGSIVEDPDLPISGYNYTALRDRLHKNGIEVSITTIIRRAKKLGCHQPRRKKKSHHREVLTAAVGALVQHGAFHHLWSPFAQEKWALITSLDDCSQKILFADFLPSDTYSGHSGIIGALRDALALLRRLFAHLSLRSRQGQLLARACARNRRRRYSMAQDDAPAQR